MPTTRAKLIGIVSVVGMTIFGLLLIVLSFHPDPVAASGDNFYSLLERAKNRGDWVAPDFAGIQNNYLAGRIANLGSDYFCLFDDGAHFPWQCMPIAEVRTIRIIMATPIPTPEATADKR